MTYSIQSKSLVEMADEIRNKTGLTGELPFEQMLIDMASLPGRLFDVPDYVYTEAKRVAEKVKALQNGGTISFIALSDIHVTTSAQDLASALHAAQGAKIISDLVPIDFSAILGDVVTGAAGDSAEQHLSNHMAALRASSVLDPALRLCGNHDANIYNADCYQTAADVHRYTTRFSRGVKPATEPERSYCYFDLTDKKLRVICLNTADLKDIPAIGSNGNAGNKDGHHISAAQFEWLVQTLDMSGKAGWRVIVLSHHPLHWYGSMPNIQKILEAYITGGSGSITADGVSISYDFSGKNAAELAATFHGHTHNLISGKVGTHEIIRMGTPNACFGRSNEYGSSAYDESFREKYGETTTYAKTANSAKDTAFCVYTIDYDKRAVFATCYGAGYDRILSYADTAYYSVTNSLVGVTSSNPAVTVEGGAAYTATLTANEGYTMGMVSVTMGGEDITATAYANGVITISEVTGDIVITASATRVPVIVDVEAVGYTNNAHWSTSTGELRTGVTGFTAINLIEFERAAGETVTIELGGINWYINTNCAIVFYTDGERIGAEQFDGQNHNYTDIGRELIVGDNGRMTVILTDPANASYTQANGFKVCGYGSGADAVITISHD